MYVVFFAGLKPVSRKRATASGPSLVAGCPAAICWPRRKTRKLIPTVSPVRRFAISSRSGTATDGEAMPPRTRTSGLRASTDFAAERKRARAGFAEPLRVCRPLCHTLVSSSRKMNQTNMSTRGSFFARPIAWVVYEAC